MGQRLKRKSIVQDSNAKFNQQQIKVKRGNSGLNINKKIRLERKGKLIARNIEVKVSLKKERNSTQDKLK